jgi:phosphatidylserine/phosphatidylglycerophosphate/cardiolipin synthase-like enzyme
VLFPEDAERRARVRMVIDREHYDLLVQEAVSSTKVSLWIATANLKSLMIEAPIGTRARASGRFISILETFEDLVARGVEIRVLHASPPSRPFQAELRKRGALMRNARFKMRACPRVHLKMIAIDGQTLYLGSANFTGAGLGAKGEGRRNFEVGILTDDHIMLDTAQARFDRIWRGAECASCKMRSVCAKPIDRLRSLR